MLKLKVRGKGVGCVVVDECRLGKVCVLTDLVDWDGERVYGLFKERECVEVAFDAVKNELENDKCYLGDGDAVRGYFLCRFCLCFCIFVFWRKFVWLR